MTAFWSLIGNRVCNAVVQSFGTALVITALVFANAVFMSAFRALVRANAHGFKRIAERLVLEATVYVHESVHELRDPNSGRELLIVSSNEQGHRVLATHGAP